MKPLNLFVLLAALAPALHAQTPPADAPKPSPQAEAGEPRANTGAQAEAGEPRAQTAPAATPAAKPAPSGKSPTPPKPAAPQKGGNDRLQLQTATVTGDREQPKVMYIVPWKRSDIGDLEGKPMNSLVDEILSPVDRDVFRREVRYYQTVNADAQGRPKPSPGQGEK
jgi:hypothetical protein